MKKLFGTDGVRGVANTGLSPELAFEIGKAGAYVLTKSATNAPRILLAKDGRRSGDMLEAALSAGLCSIGAKVYTAGVIPTPAVAHLIKKYKLDAGIMISASHNPMEDNGIKFFNAEGFKLSDQLEEEIEEIVALKKELPRPTGVDVGIIESCPNAIDDYVKFVMGTVPQLKLEGMKIALDCANGATSSVAPIVFEKLGANVHVLHNSPNGININANCGSTHMQSLADYVVANGMDLGLAFDGDGDRMLAVDENGAIIDGDIIMAICGLSMKESNSLASDTIVATVMSNQGLEVFCRDNGITLHRTAVGDRYVLKKMLEDGLALGGEQSGHLIFRQHNTTGDGILAGVQLLLAIHAKSSTAQKSLGQLSNLVEIFPQVLVNVRVAKERMSDFGTCEKIQSARKELESSLTGDERLLVRTSGTEPLVRVMLEGPDYERISSLANGLASVIKESLGG